MKSLASIQKMLIRLWLCPNYENSTDSKGITYKAFLLAHLIIHFSTAMASLAFFIKFVSIDSVRSMFSFLAFAGMICAIYVVTFRFLLRHKISTIFKHTIEWAWQFFMKYLFPTITSFASMSIVSIVICWFVHETLDVQYFFRTIPFMLVRISYDYDLCTTFSYLIPIGTFAMLFISTCIHHQPFYKIIKDLVDKWNRSEDHRSDEQFLCDLVRFHILV